MKGNVKVAMNIVAILMSLSVLGLMVSFKGSIEEKIRVDTIEVISSRIESGIYMISSVKSGSTQINLKDKYGFTKSSGNKFVNYTSEAIALKLLDHKSKKQLTPPVSFRLKSEGLTKKICLRKQKDSRVSLELGEC